MNIKRNFLVTILVGLLLSGNAFSEDVSDREEFNQLGKAMGYWLQDKSFSQVAQMKMEQEVQLFSNAAVVMLYRFFEESKSGWKVYHRASYDQFGREIPLQIQRVQIHKDGSTAKVMVSGYYFIKKEIKGKEVRIAVSPGNEYVYYPGDGSAYDDFVDVAFHRKSKKESLNDFRRQFFEFVKEKLLYKYSILDFDSGLQVKYLENVDNLAVSWDQLVLEENFKKNLYEQSQSYLEMVEHFKKMKIKTKKGLLLEGPPGTGKSLLGQVFISSIQSAKLKDKASMILVTARHLRSRNSVRRLFEAARQLSPSIVFMEDIDLLGIQSRDGLRNDDRKDDILNEFLNGIDGVVESDGVLVVGTTNQVSKVDMALRRSLRLGMHIHFGLPGFHERELFFKNLGFDDKTIWDKSLDLTELASLTEGLSGADIVELIGLARQEAYIDGSTKDGKIFVSADLFFEALDIIKRDHGGEEFQGFGFLNNMSGMSVAASSSAKKLQTSMVRYRNSKKAL